MANVISIAVKMIDQTKGGLTQPIRNLKDLEGVISKLTPAALALATTLGAAFVAVSGHAINVADEMSKMSQKAGLSTEAFSALSYAADLAGLDNTQLAKSMKELGNTMIEAQHAGSAQAAMFESIGVSTRDANGALLTTDQMLLRLADKFADTADGVGKVSAATAIFGGKLGQEMIPFLNQGAAGIRELTGEAAEFGQVVGTKAGKAAEGFNDALTRLKKLSEGFVSVFVQEMLPTMEKMANDFIEWAKHTGALALAMDGVRISAGGVADVLRFSAVYLKSFIDGVGAMIDVLIKFATVAKDAFMTVMHGSRNMGAVLLEVAKGPFGNVAQAVTDATREMRHDLTTLGTDGKDALTGVGVAAQTVAQAMNNVVLEGLGINKFVRDMKASVGTAIFGNAQQGPKPQMNATATGNSGDVLPSGKTAEGYDLEQQMILKTQELALQANASHMTLSQQMMAQNDLEKAQALEQYNARLKQIGDLSLGEERARELSRDAYYEHTTQIAKIDAEMVKSKKAAYDQMIGSTTSAFGSMAQLALTFGKKGFAAHQAFSYAEAIISVATGVARALELPWPLNLAAAASVGAAGAVQIATIANTKPPQAHAGASYIPEEATYLLSRGERVVAPQQNMDLTEFLAHGGGPMHVTINLDGREILNYIGSASRSGQLEISAHAVV
jgi:hypothetical protein